MKNEKMDLRGL